MPFVATVIVANVITLLLLRLQYDATLLMVNTTTVKTLVDFIADSHYRWESEMKRRCR